MVSGPAEVTTGFDARVRYSIPKTNNILQSINIHLGTEVECVQTLDMMPEISTISRAADIPYTNSRDGRHLCLAIARCQRFQRFGKSAAC